MISDLRVICPSRTGHLLGWVHQREDGATWEPKEGRPITLPWGAAPPDDTTVAAAINLDQPNDIGWRLADVILARCTCGNREVSVILVARAIRRGDPKLIAMRPIRASSRENV